VDPYMCGEHRQELARQIQRSRAAEIAEAPACIASWSFDAEIYERHHIDPSSPTRVAAVLSTEELDLPRSIADAMCLRDLCRWRMKWKPERWAELCQRPTT
jgi:hypothetical protein